MAVTRKPTESSPNVNLPDLNETDLLALDFVRKQGPLSRTSMAQVLGISRASVTAVAGKLIETQILEEVGHGESDGGRRPRLLDVNARLGYVAGVDIGATSVDLALANFRGEILNRESFPADVRTEPELLLEKIVTKVKGMVTTEGGSIDRLLALGMGVPGPVHYPTGLLIQPPLMPTWGDFPIKEFIRDRLPNTVPSVDNDVNIMAIGEGWVGGAVGMKNFMYVKVGTGIGCGIFIDGEIYRGSDGTAGDIGHICVDYNGPICHCGNAGCLEFLAAGPAIAKRAMEAAEQSISPLLAERMSQGGGTLTSKDVGELAASGDRVANRIVYESGRMIGGVLAGLVNFANPEAIFLGGGVSKIGHQFLSTIRQATLKRATALSTRSLQIDYSKLGDDAGVHGGIWLAIENIFDHDVAA